MRRRGGPVWLITLSALVGAVSLFGMAPYVVAQEATPAAGTPVVTAATPAPEATEAPPAAATDTDVVTMVAWYANDASGEFLNLLPITVGANQVADATANATSIGRAEFPAIEEGLPSIVLNDNVFNAYLRYEGDIAERWVWTDDTVGFRPATLVIQVQCAEGEFANYYGTATFVSRDDLAGGVVILALRPPAPANEDAAATDEAPATDETAAEGEVTE